jgi:hypothetical protein
VQEDASPSSLAAYATIICESGTVKMQDYLSLVDLDEGSNYLNRSMDNG